MDNDKQPQQQADDDEIDLFELWGVIASSWRQILGTSGLFGVIAAVVALNLTPIYRSEVLIALADSSGNKGGALAGLASQFGGLADLAGVNLGGGGGKGEAVAVLKSRTLIEGFIRSNNLLPILYTKKWDAAAGKWIEADLKKQPTMHQAVEMFQTSIMKVADDKKTGLISMSIEWEDPVLAAAWANDLVRVANDTMRLRDIDEATKSIAYLNKELQKTSVVDIQQVIYRLLESNVKTISVANAREQYSFKVIDPGVVPEKRISPKRTQIVAIALLAGLFVSVLGVFGHRALQRARISRPLIP